MHEIVNLERVHLAGIVRLCEIEGYKSYIEDAEKTWTALSSPGSFTTVAIKGDSVVGFANLMSDGVIQAHLAMLIVSREHRCQGIGRELVTRAHALAGGKWVNLLAEPDSVDFYKSFAFSEMPGFRVHPQHNEGGRYA